MGTCWTCSEVETTFLRNIGAGHVVHECNDCQTIRDNKEAAARAAKLARGPVLDTDIPF